ncbi:MAG: hypothetical protein PHI67_10750 [Candidatus Methanomethylophilaceae archaeon]|nr:hypothetical protein [Candidatus Methanomethylophilaceae archaeon]
MIVLGGFTCERSRGEGTYPVGIRPALVAVCISRPSGESPRCWRNSGSIGATWLVPAKAPAYMKQRIQNITEGTNAHFLIFIPEKNLPDPGISRENHLKNVPEKQQVLTHFCTKTMHYPYFQKKDEKKTLQEPEIEKEKVKCPVLRRR